MKNIHPAIVPELVPQPVPQLVPQSAPQLVSQLAHTNQPAAFFSDAREGAQALRQSRIREVANAGMGREGVLPFWFGEPDEVTPQFIRDAAIASLNAGETFYTHSFGIPTLRQALSDYKIGRAHV